jgi:hypothetical protein
MTERMSCFHPFSAKKHDLLPRKASITCGKILAWSMTSKDEGCTYCRSNMSHEDRHFRLSLESMGTSNLYQLGSTAGMVHPRDGLYIFIKQL